MPNEIYVSDPAWSTFTFNNVVQPVEMYDHTGTPIKEVYENTGNLVWDGVSTSFVVPSSELFIDTNNSVYDANFPFGGGTLTDSQLLEDTGYCRFWTLETLNNGSLALTITGGLQYDSTPGNIILSGNNSNAIISSKFPLSPIYDELSGYCMFRQPRSQTTDPDLRRFPRECLAWDEFKLEFNDGTTYVIPLPYHSNEYLYEFNVVNDYYISTYMHCERGSGYNTDPITNYDWGTTFVGGIQIRVANLKQYYGWGTTAWNAFQTKVRVEPFTLRIRKGPMLNEVRTWANTKANENGTKWIFDGFGPQNQGTINGITTLRPTGSTASPTYIEDTSLKPRFSYLQFTDSAMSFRNEEGNFPGYSGYTVDFDHAENRSWVLVASRFRDTLNSTDPDIEELHNIWGYNKQFIATPQVLNSSQSPLNWNVGSPSNLKKELWTYDALFPAPSNINDFRKLFPYDETFTFTLYEIYGRPYITE